MAQRLQAIKLVSQEVATVPNKNKLILLKQSTQVFGDRPLFPALNLLKRCKANTNASGMLFDLEDLSPISSVSQQFESVRMESDGLFHKLGTSFFVVYWRDAEVIFFCKVLEKLRIFTLSKPSIEVRLVKYVSRRRFTIMEFGKILFEYSYRTPFFTEFLADTWFKEDADFFSWIVELKKEPANLVIPKFGMEK